MTPDECLKKMLYAIIDCHQQDAVRTEAIAEPFELKNSAIRVQELNDGVIFYRDKACDYAAKLSEMVVAGNEPNWREAVFNLIGEMPED